MNTQQLRPATSISLQFGRSNERKLSLIFWRIKPLGGKRNAAPELVG